MVLDGVKDGLYSEVFFGTTHMDHQVRWTARWRDMERQFLNPPNSTGSKSFALRDAEATQDRKWHVDSNSNTT